MYHFKNNLKDTLRYFAKHWAEGLGIAVGTLFAIVYTMYYYQLSHKKPIPFTKLIEVQHTTTTTPATVIDTVNNTTSGFIHTSVNSISE